MFVVIVRSDLPYGPFKTEEEAIAYAKADKNIVKQYVVRVLMSP